MKQCPDHAMVSVFLINTICNAFIFHCDRIFELSINKNSGYPGWNNHTLDLYCSLGQCNTSLDEVVYRHDTSDRKYTDARIDAERKLKMADACPME